MTELIVVGGGLAGCESAWQAAQMGIRVSLYEMRPHFSTGAHTSPYLGELVCSNSFGSNLFDRAPGILKNELRMMNSLLIKCADETAIPAGDALAVDREEFARLVTVNIENHPNIEVIRKQVEDIPENVCVIASGPLTSHALALSIAKITGLENLYFYDAVAPIVALESIDMEIVFRSSRFSRDISDNGDYINCPLSQEEYETFVDALITAERNELKPFENNINTGVYTGRSQYFEGCLPVEVLAKRGGKALAFGPLRPIGLRNPKTGLRPYAVVQLRQDNLAGSLYNMVGFQTNLKYSEQIRVFRMIHGLEKAEFIRFGQMHRNTFLLSPVLLDQTLQFRNRRNIFFAGQITGVEGYAGNIATGWLAGWNAGRMLCGLEPIVLPKTTMVGALCHYIANASTEDFQPMKANLGLLPPLQENIKGKIKRREAYALRSKIDLMEFLSHNSFCA
jgi:methylenetetrahydrofolate--tRNA-(uracil-5-)-methyltransferase